MIGFVNGSTGQVNSFCTDKQPTPEFLRAIMQHNAQLWSKLLWISGGLLEFLNCLFHQIHYDFELNGTPIMCAGIYGNPIQVHDAVTVQQVTIPAKSVYTPHKTLGHHKAPAGANRTQGQVLYTNSDTYAHLNATSLFTWTNSWFFSTAVYLKALGYVLSDCYLDKKILRYTPKGSSTSIPGKVWVQP
jgi:hypothetical protein